MVVIQQTLGNSESCEVLPSTCLQILVFPMHRLQNCRVILQDMSTAGMTGIILLNALGYLIFRASNNQKNLFRHDPGHPWVKQLKTLKTDRGTELIISGWWGISRHINYFGDWLLG